MRCSAHNQWQQQWPDVLKLWGRYVQLQEPQWCLTETPDLKGQLVRIRWRDQRILVNVPLINQMNVSHFGRELLAHAVGHHIYCPFNARRYAHLMVLCHQVLDNDTAPLVAQFYADALVTTRLYRLDPALEWPSLWKQRLADLPTAWQSFYGGLLESIWHLPVGTLVNATPTVRCESRLAHQILQTYSHEWLAGARPFALLAEPYIQPYKNALAPVWQDLEWDTEDGIPAGLTQWLPEETQAVLHPANNPDLTGYCLPVAEGAESLPDSLPDSPSSHYREPLAYGELLACLGMPLAPEAATVQYYQERAWPYLVTAWPQNVPPQPEPLPESLEPWELGHALENIDWVESVLRSSRVIPGITLVERQYEQQPLSSAPQPIQYLDLLVDCSGSMPNPHRVFSCYALAAVVLVKSALQSDLAVRATLWSGKSEFYSTHTFIHDEEALLRLVTGYVGGATTFPIHLLRETYLENELAGQVQLIVISDEGINGLMEPDEMGETGYQCLQQVALRGVLGVFLLRLQGDWHGSSLMHHLQTLGWPVHVLTEPEHLVDMAQQLGLGFKQSAPVATT